MTRGNQREIDRQRAAARHDSKGAGAVGDPKKRQEADAKALQEKVRVFVFLFLLHEWFLRSYSTVSLLLHVFTDRLPPKRLQRKRQRLGLLLIPVVDLHVAMVEEL